MNRYTFKAKRKNNGEWVYGYYFELTTGYYILPLGSYYNEIDVDLGTKITINALWEENDFFEIDINTLCQCTAREDKKDNIVYEYDIVSIKYEFEGKKLEAKAMVMWDSCGMFYFEPLDENWIDDWNFQDDIGRFKIIGNKFDKEVE